MARTRPAYFEPVPPRLAHNRMRLRAGGRRQCRGAPVVALARPFGEGSRERIHATWRAGSLSRLVLQYGQAVVDVGHVHQPVRSHVDIV